MYQDNLIKQMNFLCEIEKLKTVYRQNIVIDKSRNENSAEHSWHLAVMAIILFDHSKNPDIDLLRVIKMVLIHDLVEIDAGDTFLYDETGNLDKEERENRAAERIFGLLPEEQEKEIVSLWKEFDERKTPDALFASALDNMQPVINHYLSDGCGISGHRITMTQIIEKKEFIREASPELWEYTKEIISKSAEKGFYRQETR
jgi:putative hydrolases of HD superfamily